MVANKGANAAVPSKRTRSAMGRLRTLTALPVLFVAMALAAACEGDARTADDDDAGGNDGPCTRSCLATPCCEGAECYLDHGPGSGCFTEVCRCSAGEWDCNCGTSCPDSCTYGEIRSCTCPDGTPSTRQCLAAGMCPDWSPCRCEGTGGAGGQAGSGGAAGAAGGAGGAGLGGSGGAGG